MEPNPRRNYIEQWNINVQRQITASLTATVGYIGSHGVHMLIRAMTAIWSSRRRPRWVPVAF